MESIQKFSIEEVLDGQAPRKNFNVIQLDGRYNVRLARVEGRFPWHRHTNGDEGWLVWKGRFRIDFEEGTSVEMLAGEGTRVPQGVVHSPIALEDDTIVLCFNVVDFQHEFREENPDLGGFEETDLAKP
jgi:mannose-6-phosphate isomerase-like protein (cupin superfamily)